jgi:hypothetical protein
LRRIISADAQIKGLHEGAGGGFYRLPSSCQWVLPEIQTVPPENNTLFGAALRTISRLIDNGISLEVAAPLLEWFRIG